MFKFKKTLKPKRSLQLTPRQVLWIKLVATVVLVGIMVSGFYVSFGTLVAFAATFGKLGTSAVIIALIIDTLAVLGLGITLLFPSASSKTAFLGGVGASTTMNAFVGFATAGVVGAIVAVIPQVATVLGERVVFDLLFDDTTTPLEDTSTPHQEDATELEEDLVVLDDVVEPELVIVEDPVEEFWNVPDTVEELVEEAPVHQEPTPQKVAVPVGFTQYTKEQVVEILVARGETPGRPTIMREFGVSDWTARSVIQQLKQ